MADKLTDRMPKPVDWPRWRSWVFLSSALALVAIAALGFLFAYGLISGNVVIGLAILFSVPPMVIVVGVVVAMRRRIAAARYRLCLHCQYPLDPNQPEGRCPECGEPYELAEVEQKWRAEIGAKDEDPG